MEWPVPALPFDLHPLIAEAKRRARRRALLAAIVLIAAAAAVFATESGGGGVGLCANAPSGWKTRLVRPGPLPSPLALVMTDWRFGKMDDFYGLGGSTQHWPRNAVTIAVLNEGPDATPPISPSLRVDARDFGTFEGMRFPFAERAVRSGGRVLDAYVEVGTVTPATVAAANAALGSVRACSR